MELTRGLTQKQASEKLKEVGRNEIEIKKKGILTNFIHWLISPITLMLLAASGLSLYSGRMFDFYFILSLTALNFVISAGQRSKADKAVALLQNKLIIRSKVLRDEKWQLIDSYLLVPGDVIAINVGDILPADSVIVESHNLSTNEAALTGESLPKSKDKDDKVLAGSYVATGSAYCEVKLTGRRTTFGKTLVSVEKSNKRSILEREILTITYMLSAFSLVAVAFISIFLYSKHLPLAEILRLDLSLLIAGVPVSLPTVMSIIIGLGVLELAHKQVIVRRLSSLEDLANVNLLLTDKTGTLTKNLISISEVIPFNDFKEGDILLFARSTINDIFTKDPINKAVISYSEDLGISTSDYEVINITPPDSSRKHATAKVKFKQKEYLVSFGAPQIANEVCKLGDQEKKSFQDKVLDAAKNGFRTLFVAIGENTSEEKNLKLIGLLLLSDVPFPDAKEIIEYLNEKGINVKMVTGDNLAISQRIGSELNFKNEFINRDNLREIDFKNIDKSWWNKQSGFAEILPEDKYNLTESAKNYFVVAVTGDGVNDLPALATADVGIAVKNSVDALKSIADIVILSEGITVIKSALIEARKIFERLYSYSVYRISESFRLIITIAFLGFVIHSYPLTPIQLILLAFLNDLPIISLAYNRVKSTNQPSHSRSKNRLYRGLLHGSVGVFNSLALYFVLASILHLPLALIQTAYFLKLTVSGHMLIYVAHTDERWFKFLPNKTVIFATTITQILASAFALLGLFMAPISFGLVIFVWIWSFGWMQVSDVAKALIPKK